MAMPLDEQASKDLLDQIGWAMEDSGFIRMINGQFVLWNVVTNKDLLYSPDRFSGSLQEPTVDHMRRLSDAAGGWWYFPKHDSGEVVLGEGRFVTIDEWRGIHAENSIPWPGDETA